jgi:ABC-type polysaccharide transport system permease subunit
MADVHRLVVLAVIIQAVLVEDTDLLERQALQGVVVLPLMVQWVVVVQAVYVFKETVILHIPTQAQEMAQLIHDSNKCVLAISTR